MLSVIVYLFYFSIVFTPTSGIHENKNLKKHIRTRIIESNEPVSSLDIAAYLGLWFQVYTNDIVDSTFEKDLYCVTATVSITFFNLELLDFSIYNVSFVSSKYGDSGNDDKISVDNHGVVGSPNGIALDIHGYAYQTNNTEPGKLRVHFDIMPFDGYYWILKLGR
jgi:lipocalin